MRRIIILMDTISTTLDRLDQHEEKMKLWLERGIGHKYQVIRGIGDDVNIRFFKPLEESK